MGPGSHHLSLGLSVSSLGLLLLLPLLPECLGAEGRLAHKLFRDLFANYTSALRPVADTDQALNVTLEVTLSQIIDMDERNQVLTLYLWIRQEWTDAYLRWDPDTYGGLDAIRIPSSLVWRPDIVLYNNFVESVEGRVLGMPARRRVLTYGCCSEPYPDVTFTLLLRRRAAAYVCNLLLPCVLISLLAPLAFHLPADSGEKVSLGVTVLLALTVFQLILAESMPPAESVPLIGGLRGPQGGQRDTGGEVAPHPGGWRMWPSAVMYRAAQRRHEDWKRLARVMDRFFLGIFFSMALVMSLLVLVRAL
nr:PREDICTED: neuronal acetylcholine receptor subunit alpha-10 [Bos mutus]